MIFYASVKLSKYPIEVYLNIHSLNQKETSDSANLILHGRTEADTECIVCPH